ncbi:HMA2 [Symbiodinium microadriaticum]|nr:HMA2 [Symbiodinium microadriaticum]
MQFTGVDEGAVVAAYLVCTGIGIVPIMHDAGIALYRWSIDIHILMLVAVGGAIGSEEYLDAALVVTLFVFAELLEGEVMRRVRNAVKLGVGGMAKSAVLANGDSIAVDDLQIGDFIACRAGDQVLADGIVSTGTAVVDESALTGEAIPIAKKKGDKLNEKVSEVQADRGQFAKVVDRFAGVWTPAVLLSALALAVIAGSATHDWHKWTHRALVLLVLACPCSIVIAAPIPSVCAIATAAKHGVLIKGSSVVESLGIAKKLAVDKTGTLTRGFFSVTARYYTRLLLLLIWYCSAYTCSGL